MMNFLKSSAGNFLKGIVVGVGGVSPGLSGSVLLVIFGLYRKAVEAIGTLFKDFKNNMKFLVPLGCGMVLGILAFSKLIDGVLEAFPSYTRFAFLGLILGTLPLFYREVKKEGFRKKYYIVMLLAAAGGFLFMNLMNIQQISDPNYFQSGLLGFAYAASSIVPGIDGAALMSAFGLYEAWVSALADLDLTVLIPAVAGLGIGVLGISFVVNKLLKRWYTLTFSILFGLFISIIPEVLNEGCAHLVNFGTPIEGGLSLGSFNMALSAEMLICVGLVIAGFALSFFFSNLEKFAEKKKKENTNG